MSKRTLAAAIGAMCVFCTNLAFADDNGGFIEKQLQDGQSVIFKDDPLAAGNWDPNGPIIRVLPQPKRVMLLRPRTQFILEMLKSVENI